MTRFGCCVLALVTLSSVASADVAVEVGGTAGLHIFNSHNDLGELSTNPSDGQKPSTLFGLRAGAYFAKHYGVELEFGYIPTEPNSMVFDVFDLTYRLHLVYQFSPVPGDLIPFVLIGDGITQIIYTQNADILKKDANNAPYLGAGIKYMTNGGWGVRADVRLMFPEAKDSAQSAVAGATIEFEGLLSLIHTFGGDKPVHVLPPPPPVVDNDPDHDGIVGDADKCPNEPEDKDGFEDADGCPDPDNDKDGIPDAQDKCPNEAEDKDGFQDADGCPEPDNDGDGIPDAQDKCPNEPETKNGYQDADGCPDEIPEKVKAFTGVIQGINFKSGGADLAPQSLPVLDKAVAVMTEFKDVKLEIGGHTDDVQIKSKTFADNAALSQARADAVKAYFVKKGIDASRLDSKGYGDTQPITDPKGLNGAALNAARAKNRRVEFKLVTAPSAPAAAPAPAKPAAPAATTPAPAATPAATTPAAAPTTK
jgi:OmpA-OmpF porin, OOP family